MYERKSTFSGTLLKTLVDVAENETKCARLFMARESVFGVFIFLLHGKGEQ